MADGFDVGAYAVALAQVDCLTLTSRFAEPRSRRQRQTCCGLAGSSHAVETGPRT